MMKKISILFILLGFTFIAASQSTSTEGTFQLMTTNEKVNEVFTTDIYSIIESNRKINEIAVVKVGEFTWARILSLNTISDPNFVSLPAGIIVIDANDPSITSATSILQTNTN